MVGISTMNSLQFADVTMANHNRETRFFMVYEYSQTSWRDRHVSLKIACGVALCGGMVGDARGLNCKSMLLILYQRDVHFKGHFAMRSDPNLTAI